MGCVGARPGGPSHAEFTSAMWCPLHFCNFGVEVRFGSLVTLLQPGPRKRRVAMGSSVRSA